MLIPSIDLMGGRIVQLVQGEKKALESDDFEGWAARFASYPLVQIIDLDAAMGIGDNRALVAQFACRLPCQVGGGIRSIAAGEAVLAAGARRVICGSALFREGEISVGFAEQMAAALGSEKLVFASDSKNGRVAIRGWREHTATPPAKMIQTLEPWCGAFLYTHIDTEGLMQGIPMEAVRQLRSLTEKQLMVAGGIRSREEVDQLDGMKVDAIVGMAIYTGRMKV
jgi:phosphoribosylformimino-5-aminoimidazole carboxamide ribotide isomerase